jgi:phenylacetate-CoA ligase
MSVNGEKLDAGGDNSAGPRSSSLAGYLALSGLQWLRRSQSLKLLRQIAPAPFLTADEVRAEQFRRLSELLAHAEAHVPYYREVFRSLGIGSRDIRSVKDLAQLPILTKDILRERGKDLVRDDVPLASLSVHHSGGSTGVPVTFYRDRLYMDASEAGTFRNFTQCGWRPGDMIAFFWGSNERLQQMSRTEFELRQRVRRMYQFDPFHSGPKEMEGWLERWPSLQPTVALGYASTIARFADFIEQSGKRVGPLRGVFTTAEKLYLPQRETIERVFGCHAYDCYGSSEVQNIAAECSNGSMHVNVDYVVLEVDQLAGGPEDASPLLVTSLWNYAMPFIRYRNEDCGELAAGTCGCGNNFPLMKLNVARISDSFTLPDGRVVHGEFFTHLMYGSEGIATFQFHQTSLDHITLWIVPSGPSERREKTVIKAVEQIKALTPAALTVEVRETDAIPLSAAGKHRFTRSDVAVQSVGSQ